MRYALDCTGTIQMHPLIATHRVTLEELCRRFHVRRLEFFGSAATGNFTPDRSDFDFLAQFQPLRPTEHADAYFGLLMALEDLFQRRVDLVEEGAIENPYFRDAVKETKAPLYAA